MKLVTGGKYGAGHHVWSINLSALEETYYVSVNKSVEVAMVLT